MEQKGFLLRVVICLGLSIMTIFSVIYYGYCYFINGYLVFTQADKFILYLLMTNIILMAIFFITTMLYIVQLRKEIRMILEDIANAEDNNIQFQKVTQLMIMKLSKELGVKGYQKDN